MESYAQQPVLRNGGMPPWGQSRFQAETDPTPGVLGSDPFPTGKGSDPALHQKLPLKLANTVASIARFCSVVALMPTLLCRPNSSMRAPRMAVA